MRLQVITIMVISKFTKIIGSRQDDHLVGTPQYNEIDGGAGDDVVDSGGGADVLTGGAGTDRFVVYDSGVVISDLDLLNGGEKIYFPTLDKEEVSINLLSEGKAKLTVGGISIIINNVDSTNVNFLNSSKIEFSYPENKKPRSEVEVSYDIEDGNILSVPSIAGIAVGAAIAAVGFGVCVYYLLHSSGSVRVHDETTISVQSEKLGDDGYLVHIHGEMV